MLGFDVTENQDTISEAIERHDNVLSFGATSNYKSTGLIMALCFFNKSIVTLCYRRMIKGSCHTCNQEEDGRFLDHCDHTGRIQEVSDGSLDRKKTEMTTEQTSSTSWL